MEEKILKTKWRLRKEAQDLEIYKEYQELMSVEGAMAMAVMRYLIEKYDLGAESTVWSIRKRVEKRIKSGEIKV